MELTSGIVVSLLSLLRRIFNFFVEWRHDRHEAEHQQAIHEAKEDLEDATLHGDLGDLINAAANLGKAKRK